MVNEFEEKIAYKVSIVSIIGNIALSILKFGAGIIGNSSAMISDAVHSASDVVSTLIVMLGIKMSSKEADDDHPYGHERFECISAIILAVLLAFTGFAIGSKGFETIFSGAYESIKAPSIIALYAAIISIIVKEFSYWYTRDAALKINSGSLMADAWHHRSDALSSVGSFIGILGARLGFVVLDSVASIVICLFIFKVAYDIFKDSMNKLTDTSCSTEVIYNMKELILNQTGVIDIDLINTRQFGNKIYVDVEISIDSQMTFEEAHKISHNVHDAIEDCFKDVKHCMVHMNPYKLDK